MNMRRHQQSIRFPILLAAGCVILGALVPPTLAATEDSPVGKGGRIPLQPMEQPATPDESAVVDTDRFGRVRDLAYGAFQRGYYLEALKLAQPRADMNDPVAQTLIADIYAHGFGVSPDPKKAADLYALAAQKGVADAQLQYALILFEGKFAQKDNDKALYFLREAANAGNAQAQFNLAQALAEMGKNREAVELYRKAASSKLPDAQYAMALVTAQGIGGILPDQAQAREWLRRAATMHYDTAMLDYGTWLVEGRGGDVDLKEGFQWLNRAAHIGNVAAQNRVAKLYRAGVGVEEDIPTAAAWYMRARRAGLIDDAMEDFLDGLSADQLRAAELRMESLR